MMLAGSPALNTAGSCSYAPTDRLFGSIEDGGAETGTPITTWTQLETLLDNLTEPYTRFETYLDATGQSDDDFWAAEVTEEALTAWFAAN